MSIAIKSSLAKKVDSLQYLNYLGRWDHFVQSMVGRLE